MLQSILQRWDLLMTDEKKNGLHVELDGGFSVSKQAIWRTCVILLSIGTGGGVVNTKLENAQLKQQIAEIRQEAATNKTNTEKEILRFKSVIDDVVNFLIEEKALQKSADAKKRYQEQIEKVREKMNKPISQMNYFARPIQPSIFNAPMGRN